MKSFIFVPFMQTGYRGRGAVGAIGDDAEHSSGVSEPDEAPVELDAAPKVHPLKVHDMQNIVVYEVKGFPKSFQN